MERPEMIETLEAIARDEEVNATARCTAIRTLNEMQPLVPERVGAFTDLDNVARIRGKKAP